MTEKQKTAAVKELIRISNRYEEQHMEQETKDCRDRKAALVFGDPESIAIGKKKASKRYAEHECIVCGKLIHESAYSGRAGNFKKHTKAHKKKAESTA